MLFHSTRHLLDKLRTCSLFLASRRGVGHPHQLINKVAQVALVEPVHVFDRGLEGGWPAVLDELGLHAQTGKRLAGLGHWLGCG
jgi:hypothetical protein